MNLSPTRLHALAAASALIALAGFTTAHAAPLTRDLGEGLAYQRAKNIPADLPGQSTAKKPTVLDVRYARGDADAATALDGWLKFNATPRTPILLLINAETDAALLESLSARLPSPGIVVIGSSTAKLPLDIALKIPADDERRAYEALGSGAVIESLLNDSPEKARNDEARLAKDRQGALPESASPASDDPLEEITAEKSAKAKPAPPLIDAALQRAVQLHRSLKALKRV